MGISALSGSGEGTGLFLARLVARPRSLGRRADAALWRERRRRRTRLLGLRPEDRWLAGGAARPGMLSSSLPTAGLVAIVGEPRHQQLVLYPTGAGEPKAFPARGLRVDGPPGCPTGARSSFPRPSRVAACGSRCRASRRQAAAISPEGYRMPVGCSPDGRSVGHRAGSAVLPLPARRGRADADPGLVAGDIPFVRPTAARSSFAGAERFRPASCCSTSAPARRSSGRSSCPPTPRVSHHQPGRRDARREVLRLLLHAESRGPLPRRGAEVDDAFRGTSSVPTRSSRRSARAGWARSIGRGTRGWGATSRSRCCRRRSRRTRTA